MDQDNFERVEISALGSQDIIQIGDLRGTDVSEVLVNLAASAGGTTGDGINDALVVDGGRGLRGYQCLHQRRQRRGERPGGADPHRESRRGRHVGSGWQCSQRHHHASSVAAGVARFTLLGREGNDTLIAGQGGMTLFGGDGDDLLVGASGDDVLEGGVDATSSLAVAAMTGSRATTTSPSSISARARAPAMSSIWPTWPASTTLAMFLPRRAVFGVVSSWISVTTRSPCWVSALRSCTPTTF